MKVIYLLSLLKCECHLILFLLFIVSGSFSYSLTSKRSRWCGYWRENGFDRNQQFIVFQKSQEIDILHKNLSVYQLQLLNYWTNFFCHEICITNMSVTPVFVFIKLGLVFVPMIFNWDLFRSFFLRHHCVVYLDRSRVRCIHRLWKRRRNVLD